MKDNSIDRKALDLKCINTIRGLAMDAVQKANSGHPGMPMGTAPIAYLLWTKFMKYDPDEPDWWNRDRFILSAGHGSMLLYAMLHLTGYKLSIDDIKNFRQWDSVTPGHPEYKPSSGIEATTGPLGQGFATGIGMAIGQKFLAAKYNRPDNNLFDYKIFSIVSDGDLMEGISHEAASLAGHLKLGNIIYIYDDNHITIEGKTELAFSDDTIKRFEGYNWHVQKVDDGNDLTAIRDALNIAINEQNKPSLIKVRTHIAYGSPNKQDTASAHGSPLGEDEVKKTKKNLGMDENSFFNIPEDVLNIFRSAGKKGKELSKQWHSIFHKYESAFPNEASEIKNLKGNYLPNEWDKSLSEVLGTESMASRVASGKVLNSIASKLPTLIGGSADLAPSTDTLLKEFDSFQHDKLHGRNFHFGVREHAMGAVLNGLALTGGLIPYGATFLIFSDYMKPAIRIAALSEIRSIFVFTHDSIGLGEDGPTHQPIEHLVGLRAIPNLNVIRPFLNEVPYAWKLAIENINGPSAIILTRQKLPNLSDLNVNFDKVSKGAYTLIDNKTPDIILIASGSEVHLIYEAAKKLQDKKINVKVVSMPSWKLYDMQSDEYKNDLFPDNFKFRIAVEAGSPLGWHKYVGETGIIMGVNKFGASAPGEEVLSNYGFTVDNIVSTAKSLLRKSIEKL